MQPTTTSLAIAALLATTACSTNYVPRTPGRLFVTMDSGKPSYVRDGQRYDHGLLGGGLRDAVRGNPQAEAAAEEYSSRLQTGLLVTIGGAVCTGVALGSAIADETAYNDGDYSGNNHSETKALVALGCLGLMLGGSFYAISAEPYRWDAINIFNDSPPPMPTWSSDALRSVTPISSRTNKLSIVSPGASTVEP